VNNLNELTDAIIGAAMEVHRTLGPGYRADIVINGSILVEIKAIDSLLPIHDAQLLSYLKLGGWKIGLLINFNVELLKHGLRRRVLDLAEEVIL